MSIDNRRNLRTSSDAQVSISHPNFGTINVKARDISDGGISVEIGNNVRPPVGTIVSVMIKRHKGAINAHPIQMLVKHDQHNGIIGLAFI